MPKRHRNAGIHRVGGAKKRGCKMKPSFRLKRGRSRHKKGIRNVVHGMKTSNQLQVINFDRQSTSTADAFKPDKLQAFDLNYTIQHENVDKNWMGLELSLQSLRIWLKPVREGAVMKYT